MGNNQHQTHQHEHPYIHPKKILQSNKNPPLDDITNKMQHVFGISNIPVSHRAMPSTTSRERLFESVCELSKMDRKDKQYEERISHLESEIYYLRSLIEDIHDRSQVESVIKKALYQAEENFSSEEKESGHGELILEEKPSQCQEDESIPQEESMVVEQEAQQPGATQIQSHYQEVNASVSRISQTYFQSSQ